MTDHIDIKAKHSQSDNLETQIEPLDATWSKTDVDAIWQFLGRFGKYQMIQLSLLLFIGLTLAVSVVNGMFTGKNVKFKCADETNISFPMYANESIKTTSCYVETFDNSTSKTLSKEKCTVYEYEGGDTTFSFVAEWDLVCDKEALDRLPQILTMIGMIIGATGLPHLGDRYGRRKLLIGTCLCQVAVSVLLAFVGNFELFLFLKLLSGACQQGVMVPLYNLQLEVMPLELRPLVSLLQSTVWTSSTCIVGVFGYFLREFAWRDLQLAYAIAFVPGVICLCFIDESLRWLVINGKTKEADTVLRKASRMNNRDYTDLMKTFVDSRKDLELLVPNGDGDTKDEDSEDGEDLNESFSFKSLLVNKNIRKITLVMCYTWMVCSLTYYGLILMSTSLAGDPYLNFFLLVVAEFPAGVYTYYTMKLIGRKKTIMYSNAVAGMALLLAVILSNAAPSSSIVQVILTILPLIGKSAISGSFGTVWTYTPELYPTNLRSYGVGISSTAARIGASFSPLFTLLVRKVPWAPGTLFAGVCFLSVFLMSFMPETRQRELPRSTKDVDDWFQEDINKLRAQQKEDRHGRIKQFLLGSE